MSWFTNLFGGGGGTNAILLDQMRRQNEAEVRRIQEEQRRNQEENDARVRAGNAGIAAINQQNQASLDLNQTNGNWFNNARGFAQQRMGREGIPDNYGVSDYFNTLLEREFSGLPRGSRAPESINLDTLYERAIGDTREGQRRRLSGQLDSQLGENFAVTRFGDTADDSILDSILGTQRTGAQDAITRARSRGQLNEAGLAAANRGLSEAEQRARSTLQSLGGGVLARNRDTLNNERSSLADRIRNLDLGGSIDIGGSIDAINNRANELGGRLEGDIRAAVGDTNLFDTGQLLGRAGAEQGFINPGRVGGVARREGDPLTSEFEDRRNRRTQGNVGAF